jgi:glycosyltransferase involved in cell wall biosynthesis
MRALIRASCRMLAAAWVLGPNLRECFAGLVPSERVRVVPNGVPDPGAARSRSSRAFTVLYLGQLSASKGVDDLIAAFESADLPDARLVLAGAWLTRGDEERIRRALAATRARIEWVGPVDAEAKARTLGGADVLVLPVRQPEGQPLVILEAMAAGLPVIATRRGAITDVVHDGVTGLLVPEADPGALARALERLARDPALRERLGAEGRRLWMRAFTEEHAMARVAEALEPFSGRPVREPTSDATLASRPSVAP